MVEKVKVGWALADPLPQVYICKIVILPPPLRDSAEQND